MTDPSVAYSRPQETAALLGDLAVDRHRFTEKRVLLTGESAVLATANGRTCLLEALSLLIRTCRFVDVALPADVPELEAEVRALAGRIAFGQAIRFCDRPNVTVYDAVLSVGARARAELPWTVINAHGWLARVSSGVTDLPCTCDQPNPVAALAAASLGVAEVFKRLLNLDPFRGLLLDGVVFDLFSYAVGGDDPGRPLPDRLPAELLVVGAGAIGNGVVALLRQLPINGEVRIVDPQAFGPENLGTCLMIGPADVGRPKAEAASAALRAAGIRAVGYVDDVAAFARRLGSTLTYPRVVLSGVDSIEARHGVQDLWPDIVLDGAIGAFGCQVGRHPWDADVACLRCLYRQPVGKPSELVVEQAIGLPPARIHQPDDFLVEADVWAAPDEHRAWLRERLGRPICSVVAEGMTQHLSGEKQEAGFAPSVPFVACLSAAMMVGEMIKSVAGWPSPLEPRFQFDALRGPEQGMHFPESRRSDCLCVARRDNIERLRDRRWGASAA